MLLVTTCVIASSCSKFRDSKSTQISRLTAQGEIQNQKSTSDMKESPNSNKDNSPDCGLPVIPYFKDDVLPIISKYSCVGCHGSGGGAAAGLSFDPQSYPGSSSNVEMTAAGELQKWQSAYESMKAGRMPKSQGEKPTLCELNLINAWLVKTANPEEHKLTLNTLDANGSDVSDRILFRGNCEEGKKVGLIWGGISTSVTNFDTSILNIESVLNSKSDQIDLDMNETATFDTIASNSQNLFSGPTNQSSGLCRGTYSIMVDVSLAVGSKVFLIYQKDSQSRIKVLYRNYSVTAPSPGVLAEKIESNLNTACESNLETTGITSIRKLTRTQYLNSLKDILPVGHWTNLYAAEKSNFDLIPEDKVPDSIVTLNRFSRINNRVTQDHLIAFHKSADGIAKYYTDATNVSSGTALFGACYPSSVNQTCAQGFIDQYARKFLRRKISSIVNAKLIGIFNGAPDAVTGFQDLLYYMVFSPDFLYLMENEGTVVGNTISLNSYDIASRISFGLLDTTPDDTLLDLAESDSLKSPAGLNQAISHVFTNHREELRSTQWQFVKEWLGIDKSAAFTSSPKLDTLANGILGDDNGISLKSSMKTELKDMFAFYSFDQNGSFSDLLTNEKSFSRDTRLSTLYGTSLWTGAGNPPPNQPPNQRSGFLTTAAIQASSSHSNNPFAMGGLVHKHVLCRDFGTGQPPDIMNFEIENSSMESTREKFNKLIPPGSSCLDCHSKTNPIGWAFESYDIFGRYRNGIEKIIGDDGTYLGDLEVDSSSVPEIGGTQFPISDAVDLIHNFNESKEAHVCFARQVFRFTYGRTDSDQDSCSVKRMYEKLRDGKIDDMYKEIILDPSFSKRKFN